MAGPGFFIIAVRINDQKQDNRHNSRHYKDAFCDWPADNPGKKTHLNGHERKEKASLKSGAAGYSSKLAVIAPGKWQYSQVIAKDALAIDV